MKNNTKNKRKGITATIVLSLVIFTVIGIGLASAQIAAPTVSKTAAPTDINVAGSGVNEETTITITVVGTGSTTTTTVPMDVVFALDSSGSMGWNDPDGLRKTAAKDFVNKMDSSKDQAGVVSWDDNIDFTWSLTDNFPSVKLKIDDVDSYGGTDLDVGLNSAIGLLDTGKQTDASWVIIFLSDGDGTYSHSTAVAAADKGYTVYTIGLNCPSNGVAKLQDIASTTGGKYYSSPSASNLEAIFDDIYTEITTSTIPHYVDVVEVTQSYIIDEGSFNPTPDSVSTVGGITTITWNDIGAGDGDPDLSDDETVTLSFTAKSNQCGANLDVDVFGTAKVNYDDKDGNYAGSVNIPQAKINVNCPPDADAGPDQTVEQAYHQGADVQLDGSGSSDPDGDSLTYSWAWTGGTATGMSPTVSLPLGTTTIALTISDGVLTGTDTVVITVQDTTAPVLTCPADVKIEQATAAGTVVNLTATATDICDASPTITSDELAIYPLGNTTVTFTATDASGNNASCTTTITVVDTTAPVISVTVSPDTLWPPNHKMVDIVANVTVSDICDVDPTVVLSITSNEPDNDQGKPYDPQDSTSGDGNTINDIQIGTEDYEFTLRAERAGAGDSRVYTITYEVTDASGNSANASATVVVPHDMS